MTAVRILHCHSTFSLGGKEARAVRLMNAFGDAAEHVVLSAMPDKLAARDAIAKGIKVSFPTDAPPLAGPSTPMRLWKLALYMKRFDLVLSYNWGAFDMVMARRLFGRMMKLPPIVHHEDGFNEDEAERLNRKRNRYRKLGLKAAFAWSCRRSGWSGSRGAIGAARRSVFRMACRSRPSRSRPSRARSPGSSGRGMRWWSAPLRVSAR